MNPCAASHNKASQAGVSLVELMVAITLGLVVTAGLATLFAANSRTSAEIEKANRQIENGRYATQLLTEDLRLAGFLGEFDPTALLPSTLTAPPDPCAVVSPAVLTAALPLHVQGYDDVASSPLSCVTEPIVPGTDILVIRRASTCIAGSAGCDGLSPGTPYFQASRCGKPAELGSGNVNKYFALDWNPANLNLHLNDCVNPAGLRRYLTHIYYIARNDIGADGIPTLKRVELGPDTTSGVPKFSPPVPLVEGIENLQIEYGIDTAGNTGEPGDYTADPSRYNGCVAAACVTNWLNVVAVKLHLLARNTQPSPGHTDSKTYTLGFVFGGATPAAYLYTPADKRYKRHVYETAVRLDNPAGRKQ